MVTYHLDLAVQYEPEATKSDRALFRLMPELAHAALTMTENEPGMRRWIGDVDPGTYARLACAWKLDERRLPSCRTWDGMEWERDGWSPVVWARLSVEFAAAAA
jgi:hypothetical protein